MAYGLSALTKLFTKTSTVTRKVGKILKSDVPSMKHIIQPRIPFSTVKREIFPSHQVMHDMWGLTDAHWPDRVLTKMHPKSGRLGRLSPQGKWLPPKKHDTFFVNPGDKIAQRFMIDGDMFKNAMTTDGKPLIAQLTALKKHIGENVFDNMRIGVEKGINNPKFKSWYGKLSPEKQSTVNTSMNNWEAVSVMLHKRGSKGIPTWEGATGLGKVDGMVYSSIPANKYMPHAKANIYTVHMPGNYQQIIKESRNMTADDILKHGLHIDPRNGGFSSRREAMRYLRDSNYLGKAIIFEDGYIPGSAKFAFKEKYVVDQIVDRATTLTYGSQYDTALIDQVRNVAIDAMKAGAKLENKDMVLDIMRAKFGDTAFDTMVKYLGGGVKGQDRLARAFKGEEWIAKTHKNIQSAHMLKRTGEMARRDLHITLDDMKEYINTTFRKVYMQPSIDYVDALRKSPVLAKNIDNMRYVDDMIDKVMGVPSSSYRWLRQVVSPVISKNQLDQGIRNTIQAQAMLKIGLNALMPLINATQLPLNTGALLGWSYVFKAYAFGRTKLGKMLIRRGGYTIKYEGGDIAKLAEGLDGLGTAGIMDKINSWVLKPFHMVEVRHNRAYSYLAGFLHGKEVMKIKGFHALDEYAKSVVDMTQFSYGMGSQPKIFGSLSRIPLQFKSYFIKQVNLTDQFARLAIRGVRENRPELTYPFMRLMAGYGVLGGVSATPFMNYFQERSTRLNELALKYPIAFRGLPGVFGIDITRRLSLSFPDNPDDFFSWAIGPALKDVLNLAKTMPELMRGRSGRNVARFIRGLSPLAGSILSVDKDSKGWKTVDTQGRTIARFGGGGEAILRVLGFRTTKVYNQEIKRDILRLYTEKLRSERSYFLNKLAQARLDKDMVRYRSLLAKSREILIGGVLKLGITSSDVKSTMESRNKQLSEKGISEEVRRQLQAHGNLPLLIQ